MKISDKQNTGSYQSSRQSYPMKAKATEAGIQPDIQESEQDKVTLSTQAPSPSSTKPATPLGLSKKIALYLQNQALL